MGIGTVADVATKTGGLTTAGKRTEVTRQQFLDLLVAELSHQDPMEPLKNQDFMNQIVQLQSMEATSSLTDGIKNLVLQNQIASSAGLVGSRVRGVDVDGGIAEGLVEKVEIRDGSVRLVVGGKRVAIDKITEILPTDGERSVTSGIEG